MESEANFIINEENAHFYVCNTRYQGSPVIETHQGNQFPGLHKTVAELLCEDLNSLPTVTGN